VTISKSHLSPWALEKQVDVNMSVVDVRLDVVVVRLLRSGEQHSTVSGRLEMDRDVVGVRNLRRPLVDDQLRQGV